MSLLEDLEALVTMQEELYRYGPQADRSYVHEVAPDVGLIVAMLYPKFWEQLCYFGNKTALENKSPKAHLAYALSQKGHLSPLSRALALELLETGKVPAGIAPPPESAPRALTEAQVQELFDSGNGPGPLLGAAKRIERRRHEAGQ